MIEYDENFLVFRKTDQRWRKDFHFFIFIFAYVGSSVNRGKNEKKKIDSNSIEKCRKNKY